MTSIVTQAKHMRNIDLHGLLQVSQTEIYNAVAGQKWNWNHLIQSIRSTSNQNNDYSDKILALRAETDTIKQKVAQSLSSQSPRTNRNT